MTEYATHNRLSQQQDINVLALVKLASGERYVLLFDDENRVETIRQIGRWAAEPELSFTWYDAAVMSQKIRKTTGELDDRVPQPRLPG